MRSQNINKVDKILVGKYDKREFNLKQLIFVRFYDSLECGEKAVTKLSTHDMLMYIYKIINYI